MRSILRFGSRVGFVCSCLLALSPRLASAQASETQVFVELPPGATPSQPAPTPPTVVVDVGALPLTPDAVREAVGAELEARAVAPEDAAEPGAGRLVVRIDADERLIVEFIDAEGSRLVRTVAASDDPRALLMTIAFLAGNLARDQVSALIDRPGAPVIAPRAATVGDVLAPPPLIVEVDRVEVLERASMPITSIGLDLGLGGVLARVLGSYEGLDAFGQIELSALFYLFGPNVSVGGRVGTENGWLALVDGPVQEDRTSDLAVWYTGAVQLETQVERVSLTVAIDGGIFHPNLMRPDGRFVNTRIVPYASLRVGAYYPLADMVELGVSAYAATTFLDVQKFDDVRAPLRFGGTVSTRVLIR
ncbi:MAG: hypothetical protein AB7S26_40115 [Sandaracinaceae bacterium]